MRRAVIALGVLVVAGASGAGVLLSRPSAAADSSAGANQPTTGLVAVVRTTLVATQPVTGQVTSSETWAVGPPTGSTPDEVAAASDGVATAEAQLVATRSALVGARRTRTLVGASDDAAVAAAPAGAARREAVRARSLDRIQQDEGVSASRAAVTNAQRSLAAARRELSARLASEAAPGGTVTALPAPGKTVARGEVLYALAGHPTFLLVGTTPAFRALREGDTGPDVAQLQANLVELGYGGAPAIRTDGSFDHATTLAVRRWQAAGHVEPTGVVRLGDTVILPAAVRVSAAHVAVGGGTQPGGAILDVASVDEVVKLQVDPGLAPSVHVGDPIRFTAPDRAEIPGSVVSVGAPAPSTQDGPNGPAGQLQVEVVAEATDPVSLAGLDGLTLTADVTTGTAPDALAVPVAALVVLGDGSFGVEVAAAGTTRFVRVTPGIYDRTMVELQGDAIAAGDQVVVPGT